MVPIKNFIEDAVRNLKKMKVLNCLDIRTYKRDRRVVIEKLDDGYNLYEDGFYNEEFKALSEDELRKLLKVMQKKEFPRSNFVRFYLLARKDV